MFTGFLFVPPIFCCVAMPSAFVCGGFFGAAAYSLTSWRMVFS